MTLEANLYLALIPTGLVIGHLGIAVRIFRGGPSVERFVRWLSLMWSAALIIVWGLRASIAGHMPLFGMYESALSLALATVIVAVCWEVLHQGRTIITPLAVLIGAALLSHGKTFDPTPFALTISERSWVVDVHAVIAWLAFGVLALSNFLALRIVLGRTDGDDLEPHLVSSLRVGFLLLTGMIASGSVYKFMLFGSPWSFDPVESMALVVWMAYATLLHLHLFVGWRGKRLARWTLGLFVLLVISYRCLVYFPAWSTYHIFDMDRRIHVGPEQLRFGDENQ
ncbi:MAG: cytochrome c biogenesis protein [Thermoanaerobaculales bacterium]|nr:cytochrome c biogenesis protein [Thermoanaerobaculales bacterium]